MSYVALAGVVVSAGTAAYSSYSSKKDAEKVASAGGAMKPVTMPEYPDYIPYNRDQLADTATVFDRRAYQNSDVDFGKRHAGLVNAERLFEAQTLKDQKGDTELMPALQAQFQRAGLQNALSSFGDTPGTLAPGSSGEASVARNLGLNILDLQDRNRRNRIQSLTTAEELFPRRTFGLSGGDAVNIEMANVQGLNNANQSQYNSQLQFLTGQQNAAQSGANAQAAAGAQANAAKQQALIQAGQLAGQLGAQYAGSRATTGGTVKPTGVNTGAGTVGAAKYNTTGWKTGPQAGTYYVPQ